MNKLSACPDIRDYQGLASGQLPIEVKESLLRHLEGCDSCVLKIQALPAEDTLVGWIKQVKTLSGRPEEKQLAPLIQRLIQLRQAGAAAPKAAPVRTFSFSCPGCGKALRVKEEAAGKKVKCPHCGQVAQTPAAVSPGGEAKATPLGQETGIFQPSDSIVQTQVAASSKDQKLCSFLAPSQAADELGRLGPYRVLKVLGAGGMGVVFRAEDPQLQRLVALKAMLPDLAENESARQRFLREARAAAKLHHDHIVTIFQVGEDRGAPFLAMEFLEGEALEDRLKREGKLPLAEVTRIGREIAEGLEAAHELGLIHRDIKPGNVWLEGKRGRVKILDFGLARSAKEDVHLTQSGAIVGTPAYMPPEQARGEAVDGRCDLYSLGCVLYRLCTGELPFKGDNTMSLLLALATEQPKSVRELNADVPLALADLIMRLLAKDPAQRPATAGEVAETLQGLERILLHEQGPHAPAVFSTSSAVAGRLRHLAGSTPAKPRRRMLLVGAVVLLVGLLLAAVVFSLRTKQGTLEVTVSEPDVQVFIDGQEKVVLESKKTGRIELIPGGHRLTVKRGDEELYAEEFTLKSGGEVVIDAKWLPKEVAGTKPSVDEAWLKEVAALPAEKQVAAVVAKLKERNPGFDGKVTHKIEKSEVIELGLTGRVKDISPVRALSELRSLTCWDGPLSDLSPLKGMKLTFLWCGRTKVSDLSPLKGMKLTHMNVEWSPVSDLSVLQGMPLRELNCNNTKVADLSPLKGMKLTYLQMWAAPVSDLSPLTGMPLTWLNCGMTQVSDLSPLKGMPLTTLGCPLTKVSDLSPLKGMKLTVLVCNNTQVSDLSPLKDMPLKELYCDFKPERDAEILRSLKTLEKINDKPAAEFWKEVDAKQPRAASPLDALDPAQIPASERFAWQPKELVAVLGEHRQRHWGFITGLAFSPDGATAATSGDDRYVRFWDIASLEPRGVSEKLGESQFLALAYVPAGPRKGLVWCRFGHPGGKTHLLDPKTGRLDPCGPDWILPVPQGSGSDAQLAVSSDGNRLAFESSKVDVWDVSGEKPKRLPELKATQDAPIAFVPGSSVLAYGSSEKEIRLVDTAKPDMPEVARLSHEQRVFSIAFAGNGKQLATAAQGRITLWDRADKGWTKRTTFQVHSPAYTYYLYFSNSGKQLVVSGHYSFPPEVWDVDRPKPAFRLRLGEAYMRAAFTPDDRCLIATGGSLVQRWKLGDKEAVEEPKIPLDRLFDGEWLNDQMSLSADGRRLASRTIEGKVRLWDLGGPQPRECRPATDSPSRDWPPQGWVTAFSPDGTLLATWYWKSPFTRLWDVSGPTPRLSERYKSTVNQMVTALSQDGKQSYAIEMEQQAARLLVLDGSGPVLRRTAAVEISANTRSGGLIRTRLSGGTLAFQLRGEWGA